MKNIKIILTGALMAGLFTGCVSDDDFELAPFNEVFFSENFQEAVDNTTLDIEGWTNIAAEGGTMWTEQVYQSNGYAEFSTFNSGDDVNVGYLITPVFNLDETAKILTFEAAQHHLDSPDNTLEILISEDFDGTNFDVATWHSLSANLPDMDDPWYDFIPSGEVDLSAYSGTAYIAFKVTGSGNDEELDGAYQIDNVKILK